MYEQQFSKKLAHELKKNINIFYTILCVYDSKRKKNQNLQYVNNLTIWNNLLKFKKKKRRTGWTQ